MTTVTSEPATAPTAPTEVYREIPIRQLFDSALNPRRRFDDRKIQELAASIKVHGVIEPLVVRPRVSGGYEVVAGHYRIRAVMAADLETAPCVLRQLTDVETLEVMLIENKHRADVHPLDEADGYARLMELDGAYTVAAIAAKMGISESSVYRRLKLRDLIPAARAHFERDEITAAHAELLATLTPEQQKRALPECFYNLFRVANDVDESRVQRRDVQPVAKLRAWVEDHVKLEPTAEHVAHYFPEIAAAIRDAAQDPEHAKLLALSESHMPGPVLGKGHGALPVRSWIEIGPGQKRCAHAQRGVVVHGGPQRVITVCATKGCPKHFPAPKKTAPNGTTSSAADRAKQERDKWAAARQREEERRKAWDDLMPKALAGFAVHVKNQKMTGGLLRMALDGRGCDVADIEKVLGGRITDENMGQAAALACVEDWDRDRFLKSVKPFGFNLGPIEQAQKAELKAAARTPLGKGKTSHKRAKKATLPKSR